MRRLALALAALLAACSNEPRRSFTVALGNGASPRVLEAASRLGVEGAAGVPAGLEIADAADAQGRTLSAARLRFLLARAVARHAPGLVLMPPRFTPGRDWLDYPEEWQAPVRAWREFSAVRESVETGRALAAPFSGGPELLSREWSRRGRRLAVVVNDGLDLEPLAEAALAGRRALFEPRADPREALVSCPMGLCLPPGRALWLEGGPEAAQP